MQGPARISRSLEIAPGSPAQPNPLGTGVPLSPAALPVSSSETTHKRTSELGTLAWERMSAQVDALSAAWQGDDLPPDLRGFVPAGEGPMRRMLLVELIKIDLEFRWLHHGLPKMVEEYAAEFPELTASGELPCDLIYEEFHIRSQTDEPPAASAYFDRFPAQREQLQRLLNLQTNRTVSTVMGRARDPAIEIGQQIDEFEILHRLGKGAFASVYLARQRTMQRLVALKVSRDRGDEPATLAQLDHPHIVRVYDYRVLDSRQLRLLYMQYVQGGTLHAVVDLARNTPAEQRSGRTLFEGIDWTLSNRGEDPSEDSSLRRRLSKASWPQVVCWLGARLAAALEYAHQRNVLHRDVKPANVLLTPEGSPKLADFNVSFSSKLDGATPAAYFGGSLAYMSPEQLEASNPAHGRSPATLDGKSDVYSLGVMLWELLTGRRPFGDEHIEGSWIETLALLTSRRLEGVPAAAIAALPRDIPPGLREVLLGCLSPQVEDRPTAGALVRQLELCLQPRAQRLFRPAPGTISGWLRKYPVSSFVLAGVAPNVLFSAVNLTWNASLVIAGLPAEVQKIFWEMEVGLINGIAYLIGVTLGVRWAWPALKIARAVAATGKLPPGARIDALAPIRRRALWLGDRISWITAALWIFSGFAFPLGLYLKAGDDYQLDAPLYEHFISTQLLSGLICSMQVFFLITLLEVRNLLPVLSPPGSVQLAEVEQFSRLERRCGWYFGCAFSAPFIAVFGLAMSTTEFRWPIGLVAVLGVLGSGLAFFLMRMIQSDLGALALSVDPNRDSLSSAGETTESFWTASR